MRGVPGEEKPAVLHRLGDEAAHAGDALLEHRPLGERPAVDPEPRLQLAPDAVVGPLGDVLVGPALDIEARELRRAEAEEREAALVVRVDQLVVRGRDRGEDAEPAVRVVALERPEHARGDRRAADAVEPVAAGDHVAFQLLAGALVGETDPRPLGLDRLDGDVVDLEEQRRAGLEPRGDQSP